MLSSELANESSQIPIRNAAALALKNNLSARIQYTTRRLSLDNDTKAKIKQEVLVTLASPLLGAGGFAQVVTAIASVVFPHDQWPDLIELVLLLSFMNNLTNTNLRIATLQTIGYICESIKPDILSLRSNEILTAVIRGARQHEPPSGVQLAAVHALYNSLEFVHENFEREGERNHIIRVMCEATQNPSVSCSRQDHGPYYVLYRDGFWTTVCEEGIELAHEAREAADYGEPPEAESKFFAKIALPEVIPVLLSLLTFQEDVVDEDERNVSMSISTCFNFIARAVTDPIVDAVIPFIEAYIKSPDRHQWEAAVMALWVSQALPSLMGMTSDSNVHVKDTVAWTLGRIHGLLIATIKPDAHLHPLVPALVTGVQDNLRTLEFLEEESVPSQTSHLSPYFDGVVNTLLRVTDTASNEANSRTSVYGAITSHVTHERRDTRMQIVGIDDRNNWNEPQSNHCSVVIRTRWLGEGIQPMAGHIMTLTSTVLEDAFLAVVWLASGEQTTCHEALACFFSFIFRLSYNFYRYCLDSSIDLHTPLL
ncbi:armadillo-type protein [Pisolithus albus]|nr:armadillo-type protein [Pisolithus albus]